ncbi:MAG: alkaline phosphatase D family protein [Phycisphaerae bacterium]|nr:alkaline phosphatase D family protein [Phycisphaerae bacterium]
MIQKQIRIVICLSLLFAITMAGCSQTEIFKTSTPNPPFNSGQISTEIDRYFLAPQFWSNPLQDWKLADGKIQCNVSGGDRNVYLLTHETTANAGSIITSVQLGQLEPDLAKLDQGWVGFKVGVRGEFNDYRDSAVRGIGYPIGITTDGKLFIGNLDNNTEQVPTPLNNIELKLIAKPQTDGNYKIEMAAYKEGKIIAGIKRENIDPDWLNGGLALACSRGKILDTPAKRPNIDDGNWGMRAGTGRGGNVRFWFGNWTVKGSKIIAKPDQTFGPIMFAQHTLSNNILKLTAQMAPIGPAESQFVQLQILKDKQWHALEKSQIHPLSRTATFRIPQWNDTKDTPYRLCYEYTQTSGKVTNEYFTGTIRKDPRNKKELVVASFTGNNDLGFPNNDFVKSVEFHNPDLLFFSGDQIYEGVGGYGVQYDPVDYLRKWYLYGWAYKHLLANIPAIAIPDDHDVYHGNIWGAGGKATPAGKGGAAAQDAGGYKMPPELVNAVQRTQTSHMPDPYDPTPVLQDIDVYYCNMNYGGVSFGVIEDRKFKSAPKPLLPDAEIYNGWPQNKDFNAKASADVPGAKLLGERQLTFLNDWATDWSGDVYMKVLLSQTIFANVATLPANEMSDAAVPRLRILNEGEYPEDDMPVSDFDSNGWPQTGRNNALKAIRKGFTFHIAGDQHLGSTIQYGIDEYNDAGFALCVPSVSNVWPRRWYPCIPGANHKEGQPKYTGDFEDGFGNKITVHAVSNPLFTGLKPERLYDRATGYGITRFNLDTRDITIECWPRLTDPSKKDAKQYTGWPITINQMDNYSRKALGFLPTLKIKGATDPVIKVIDEATGQPIYAIRIKGNTFQPKVFTEGSYTIEVGKPDKTTTTITGVTIDPDSTIEVKL